MDTFDLTHTLPHSSSPHRGVARVSQLMFANDSDTVVMSTIEKHMRKLIIVSSDQGLNSVECSNSI